MNLDWFQYWSSINPDKIACITVEDNASYSYQFINDTAIKWTAYLQHELKLKPGSRICMLAENCIENIILFSVAQKLGVVLIPLNFRLSKNEIDWLIQDANPAVILYDKKYETLVEGSTLACQFLGLETISDLVKETSYTLHKVSFNLDDTLFILYTSGSTGVPKGALYTHKMLFWNSVNTAVSLHITSDTVTLNVMPPFHTGGWNVLVTPIFHHGGKVILMKRFVANKVLVELAEHNCTQFMAVPTMLRMLSEAENFDRIKLPNLPYIIVGGESMPLNLINTYNEKNIDIRQGYGMTEVGPNLTSLHQKYVLEKQGSIGKPNMYINVKLVNEKGEIVKTGERGELCFYGDCVTPGYWNRPDATKDAIKNGWFHSGDIATVDNDGFYYIVDRIKNMFISGGENVYPAEIEKVLISHPEIKEAIIIGIKDEEWGEVGKAFLVCDSELRIEEIKKFCLQYLSKFKIPKHYRFVKEIPKLDNGKIDRKHPTLS
ncbi:class I adenylate-forming enzyme family protein [Portibacter lacus]|uniref:Acid--CoA ligase n=1 Tax=Portibacter lacus TaxID=1099794 RepID=A0AA37STL6_9BACT|nr:AMP-binding protein [Portibacter lacus]GLR20017.1 acid--CoA ligase [Portibacter lacus]